MYLYSIRRDVCNLLLFIFCIIISAVQPLGEVIWAVNSGGDAHTDANGIRYQKDTSDTGVASDFGTSLRIQRIMPQDQPLYQTERYDTDTFGYDIPIKGDGNYVLVLKFSEVWFTASNQKVFDVLLNNQHIVVDQLDIYHQVGRATAHDEIVPFSIKGKRLHVSGQVSVLEGSKLRVDFVKGEKDNPKINALYVMKGSVEDVPQLPPMPGGEKPQFADEEEEEEEDFRQSGSKKKVAGEPKVQDPYAVDDTSSMMLPVVVAIGAFLPLVFCLCRL